MTDLFGAAGLEKEAPRPLADQLRPTSLSQVVGQDHVIGPDGPLGRMIAANRPVQRPPQAKLLVIDARGEINHAPRAAFVEFLRPGDLVIANDAATLPASLRGEHVPSGATVGVRA